MSDSRGMYLFKNTAAFTLSSVGTKLISFFLVPIYTHALVPADYGVADLVSTVSFVVAPILTMNIADAVMRFCLDLNAEKSRIFSIGASIFAAASVVGLLVIPIANAIPITSGFGFYIYLYCIGIASSSITQAFLRGLEMLKEYAISTIIQSFSAAGLNILFLTIFHWGVAGYFAAYIASFFAATLYSSIVARVPRYLSLLSIDFVLFKQMTKYSIVLIPNTFMWWIINSSDRVMVTAIVGAAASGLLGVSYKLPSVISTLSTTFTKAWSFSAIRENESDDRDRYNARMLDALISFTALLVAVLLPILRPLTSIYVAPEYYDSWVCGIWLLVGNGFLTLASFLGAQYTVHKDSLGYLLSGCVGAGVNLSFNLLLIPHLGALGAAFSTQFSYVAVFFYRLWDTRKYISLSLNWKRHLLALASIVAIELILFMRCPGDTLIALCLALVIIVLYRRSILWAINASRALLHERKAQ